VSKFNSVKLRNFTTFSFSGQLLSSTAIPLLCKRKAKAVMDTTSITAILTTVSTTIGTVGGIIASAVGFFMIVKVVKWIRK
jgi:hypothetical protein